MKQKSAIVRTTLTLVLALCYATVVQGQLPITITKNGRIEFGGKTSKDGTERDFTPNIQLHGYAQAGYTYDHKGGENTNTFDVKRVLFWADAQITDRWSFLFMHDFSSVVQEFYTDFRITRNKALTVRVGQFKNALSFENPLSPTAMEAIDVYSEAVTFLTGCGSDPLLGVQYGRDLGLSLFGVTNNRKLRYELQVMNGQGINKKDGNNFKDFIGRIEYRPTESLNLIATGQIGRGHAVSYSVFNPTIAAGKDYKRNRTTIGADYKSKAFKAHGEYLNGWDGDAHSWGAYITGSVPLGTPKVEFVGSYDFYNFNTDLGMDQHKAIAGFQYWFFKKCRVQVQYVYKSAYLTGKASDPTTQFVHGADHGILCQMQVRFN